MNHRCCSKGMLWFCTLMALTNSLLAGELPRVTPDKVGMSAVELDKIEGIVTGWIEKKRLAGATVAVARHGQIAYLKEFGKKDIEGNRPMTEDTLFRIYSMSKAISTAAAMILVEEGKIGLDDPVSKYIPEFAGVQVWTAEGLRPAKRQPTVRDLIRHTAGLSYGSTDSAVDKQYKEAKILDRNIDLRTMCAALGKIPLNFDPGSAWQYSVGIDVLGRVIEVASGRSFEAFLEERIFRPLDLKDTGFYVPSEKASRFSVCYHPDGKGGLTVQDPAVGSVYLTKPKFFSGGGGLVSTTRDYLRFLVMIQNRGELDGVRILKSETVAMMIHNDLPAEIMPIRFGKEMRYGMGFGLGFNVRVEASDKWDPASPVGEYGWGGAASTHYWISPKNDLVVVTMEQTMPFDFLLEHSLKGLIYGAVAN